MKSISQQIVELLGGCWHISMENLPEMCSKCGKWVHSNPNYEDDAGAVALLKVMEGREDWGAFIEQIGCRIKGVFEMVETKYFNTPGLLAKVVLEWLRRGRND